MSCHDDIVIPSRILSPHRPPLGEGRLRGVLQAAPGQEAPQPEVRLRRQREDDDQQTQVGVRLPVHLEAGGHVQGLNGRVT